MKTHFSLPTPFPSPRACALGCGGKRSATPLSDAPHAGEKRRRRCALPAHSIRFATTLVLLLPFILHTSSLIPSARAQTTAFTYQGFLTDSGAPANGNYDLRLRVASDPLGNTYVSANIFVDDLSVANGLFTLTLDFGAGVFDGGARWLEIGVRPNASSGPYTVLELLTAFTAAPYAIRAASATAFTGTISDFQLSGNVALLSSNRTFSGTVTFSPSSGSPFLVGNSTRVTNLNADLLDGLDSSLFIRRDVNQLVSNTLTFSNFPGVAPFIVSTSTLVTNLNADLLDGLHATNFVAKSGDTMNGLLGIGISPAYQLQLSTDSAGKPNGGSWANSSDARLKKNILPLTGALEKLGQLRGVRFEWVNPEDHSNQHGPQGGFIAQEVERTFPHWITPVAAAEHDRALTDDGKIRSLTLPFEFDALVVEAIKEQQQQIKARDAEIGELKQRLDSVEKFLKRLTTSQTGGER